MRTRSRFFSHWQNWMGLLIVFGLLMLAISAPLLSPNDPQNPGPMKVVGRVRNLIPQPPGLNAPLGTLPRQISVYHALIWGTRSALIFGVVVTAISTIIGVLVGTISAYYGGFINNLLMWVSDSFTAFPIIAIVVLIKQIITISLHNLGIIIDRWGTMSFFPSGNVSELPTEAVSLMDRLQQIDPIFIAFILFSWMPYARIINSTVLRIKETEYIMAARASGVRNSKIIFRYVIPNAIAPVIVLAAKDVGAVVVLQTTFAFIGFGGNSPWAAVLVLGRDWIYAPQGILTYWWVFLPVTLLLVIFGIGWNLLGDGLNEALNPRVSD